MRVLVVEDEARLARNIARILKEKGDFAVDISGDGLDARHLALSEPYDLIVLDLLLPKVGGLDILRAMRTKGKRTPVLILTARDAADDVVRGLDLGADDYMTKPFEIAELLARCKALIRRAYDRPSPVVAAGDLEINTAAHTVRHKGKTHALPAMEYRLLEYLAMRAGQVVTKEEILEHLYDFDSDRFSNVVEVYVSALRKRFGPESIRTVRGQGYLIGEDPE